MSTRYNSTHFPKCSVWAVMWTDLTWHLATMSTPSTPTAQEQNEDIEYKNTALESLETPRSRLESTSTPNLLLGPENIDVPVVPGSPRGNLTRSRTLPRSPSYIPTQTFAELEEDKLRRFRQWMVCIAIGIHHPNSVITSN